MRRTHHVPPFPHCVIVVPQFLQSQATGPLATFLDFITYEDLITNISFIITSMIKGADPTTLLHKSLPLGKSPHLRSVMTFENFEGSDGLVELYRTVLIDTPVAHYFENYFNSEIKSDSPSREIQRVYNEVEIDIITNMLQKLWLEDFYFYCQRLGGETAVIMKTLLEFEADRRAISIMINSFNTNLNDPSNRDTERKKLFCSFGTLYPEATLIRFSTVGDINQLAVALEPYKVYSDLYRQSQEGGGKSLEDLLYEEEVKLCRLCFDGQSHFASFYGWVKLKKQELRNIKWILSCINQKRDQKDFNKCQLHTQRHTNLPIDQSVTQSPHSRSVHYSHSPLPPSVYVLFCMCVCVCHCYVTAGIKTF